MRQMAIRDWRFEEARAMVNKSLRGLTLLCYRYLYPGMPPPGLVTLDAMWGTVIHYWIDVVCRLGMKQEQKRRAVISHLKIVFHEDRLIDRKRVLNMYVYQLIKRVLRKYPKEVMRKPREVLQWINVYSYADVKRPLPRPPHVSNSLLKKQIYAVTALRRLM